MSAFLFLVVLLGAVLWRASATFAQQLTFGQPLLFSDVDDSVGVAGAALAPNGAAWMLGTPPGGAWCSYSLVEFAPDGVPAPWLVQGVGSLDRCAGPVVPALAVSGVRATVAWTTGRAYGQPGGRIFARRCSERLACLVYGPQLVASWLPPEVRFRQAEGPAWAEPALASVGRYTVLVFDAASGGNPQMMWAQSSGNSLFGPVHSFGVGGDSGPVIVTEPDGRVFTAWFEGCGAGANASARIAFAQWTPLQGFSTVQTTTGGRGSTCTGLSAAATSRGVTLAWLQGEHSGSGPLHVPVWTLTVHNGHASKATVAYAAGSSRFSLAGAKDVVALAPWYNGPASDPALVLTSVAGRPFGTPVLLGSDSGPPAVGVDGAGDVLATWSEESADGTGTQELAIAWHAGAFSTPQALDLPAGRNVTPTIHTSGKRALITGRLAGLTVSW